MEEELRKNISVNSPYFSKLASLIPLKYFHGDDPAESGPSLRYMKKDERAQTKRKRKQLQKENKRAKLDPEGIQARVLATAAERQGDVTDAGTSTVEEAPIATLGNLRFQLPESLAPSKEDLRMRLKKAIQQRKNERNATDQERRHTVADAKNWRNQAVSKTRTETRQERPVGKAGREGGSTKAAHGGPVNLAFGRVELDPGHRQGGKTGKPKPSKQALLVDAERKAQEKEELAKSGTGKEHLEQQAWRAALMRADNVKVLDDPKLLRRSVKKEQKVKDKKREQWKERTSRVQQDKQSRQAKRDDHLKARAQVKKQKKKERREKKLLRPGFEGRVDGFLGSKK